MVSNVPGFEWYEAVSEPEFEQGDFLDNLPIVIQSSDMSTSIEQIESEGPLTDVKIVNVIIMTQSCDFQKLQNDGLVTLCARSPFNELYSGLSNNKKKDQWARLIAGRIIDAHLLNQCSIPGYEFDYQVVTLSKIFSVPFGYVKRFGAKQGKRIRLLPPYREHLAQAFARRFMRVGLPIDLPRDFPY